MVHRRSFLVARTTVLFLLFLLTWSPTTTHVVLAKTTTSLRDRIAAQLGTTPVKLGTHLPKAGGLQTPPRKQQASASPAKSRASRDIAGFREFTPFAPKQKTEFLVADEADVASGLLFAASKGLGLEAGVAVFLNKKFPGGAAQNFKVAYHSTTNKGQEAQLTYVKLRVEFGGIPVENSFATLTLGADGSGVAFGFTGVAFTAVKQPFPQQEKTTELDSAFISPRDAVKALCDWLQVSVTPNEFERLMQSKSSVPLNHTQILDSATTQRVYVQTEGGDVVPAIAVELTTVLGFPVGGAVAAGKPGTGGALPRILRVSKGYSEFGYRAFDIRTSIPIDPVTRLHQPTVAIPTDHGWVFVPPAVPARLAGNAAEVMFTYAIANAHDRDARMWDSPTGRRMGGFRNRVQCTPNTPLGDFTYVYDEHVNPDQNNNPNALMTNAFVAVSQLHDIFEHYGFDENAGNMQWTNTMHGPQDCGLAGNLACDHDSVNIELYQYPTAFESLIEANNAALISRRDGAPPKMKLLTYDTNTPNVFLHSAFGNEIITHEYGHAVSHRLVNKNAENPLPLSGNVETEGMSEGYSDIFSIIMSLKGTEDPTTYEFTQGGYLTPSRGARKYSVKTVTEGLLMFRQTYMFNRGHTYARLNLQPLDPNNAMHTTQEKHEVGHVWASMLNDVLWQLIRFTGTMSQDIYSPTPLAAGNTLMLRLVMLSIRMLPAFGTSFRAGKLAMLQAANTLFAGNAVQRKTIKCAIATGFAKRGLGHGAEEGYLTQQWTDEFTVGPLCAGVVPPPEQGYPINRVDANSYAGHFP